MKNFKTAVNIGHSHLLVGAQDGIDPAQKDYRWTKEANDNALLAGVLIRELATSAILECAIFQQQGRETLSSLVQRIKVFGPAVMISLHRNCVTNPKACGWSFWYHGHDARGKELADNIASVLSKISNIRGDPAGRVRSDYEIYPPDEKKGKKGGFGVLRQLSDRSVVFEGGFISNPEDEVWYDDPAILLAIARAMRLGMEDFAEQTNGILH